MFFFHDAVNLEEIVLFVTLAELLNLSHTTGRSESIGSFLASEETLHDSRYSM